MKLSVVLPVFNSSEYVVDAIKSILEQPFHDFELIIIDDGSTDDSVDKISSFLFDSRVRLHQNQKNIGLIESLNLGIGMSSGDYIARMDSDDISSLSRFEKQVNFLDNNFNYDVVGCWVDFFNESGILGTWRPPSDWKHVNIRLMFQSAVPHPGVMVRKTVFQDAMYDKNFVHTEDYALWCNLASRGIRITNLEEVLLSYRVHSKQTSNVFKKSQLESKKAIQKLYLKSIIKPGVLIDSRSHSLMNLDRSINLKEAFVLRRWIQIISSRKNYVFDIEAKTLKREISLHLRFTLKKENAFFQKMLFSVYFFRYLKIKDFVWILLKR